MTLPEAVSTPCTTNGYLAGEQFAFLFWGCQDCGHSRMLHPGRHNPGVESCVLCRLEALAQGSAEDDDAPA